MRRRPLIAAAALAVAVAGLAPGAGVARAAPGDVSILIHTVPKGPQLRFQLAGRVYTTSKQGRTVIPAADLSRISKNVRSHRLLLAQHIKLLPNRRPDGSEFRLERWFSRADAAIPTLTAAIDLYRPVRFSLVSRAGKPISLTRLDAFEMKRIDGAVIRLTRDQLARPVMLQSSRVVPLNGALVSKDLLYRIQRVSVAGNNLVNRAQQSFLPAKSLTVTLRLLFYSVRFQARDTLFGFPIGSGIRLVSPDGQSTVHRFRDNGEVALAALPRGTYHVSVVAPGLSPLSPVSITRDHVNELKVLSYLDIGVLAMLFFSVLIGLVLVRREALRHRLSPLRRLRRRRAVQRSA